MNRSIVLGMMCLIASISFGQLQHSEDLNEFMFTETVVQDAPADTSWKKGGLFALNFGQVAFNNWAAGGVNSVSGIALVNLFANMTKGKSTWDNTLDLAYGQLKQKNLDAVKSDDKIDLSSKYGYQAWSDKWYYSGLLNFKTQFAEGLNPDNGSRISDLLAPAYVLFALGADYKPNDKFSAFISPVTAKWTIVTDQDLADVGAFGVQGAAFDDSGAMINEGENSRSEFGAYARAQFQDDLMENVNFLTRMELFQNYDTFGLVDVNWEALLGLKVNKYISATVGAQMLYDHDILILKDADPAEGNPGGFGRTAQFKETLNLGFLYNF
ncbi:MAG: DUF3078 domain-containing protein [Flavobacteriales bacterium]|nr:DUF3078 domain-containing protein [Flavobacteriales bacterium]